jgi:molecular chaperone GrpE
MLSAQHILTSLYHSNCNIETLLNDLKYILLPDAIRFYTKNRQYSHFERSFDKQDVSWIQFPLDIKSFNEEDIFCLNKYLSNKIKPCCMGETTDIKAFEISNNHLPDDYFYGIKKHLIQDQEYDLFIRNIIDCENMYSDIFYYNDKILNKDEVRNLITDIELYGICILSMLIYEKSEGLITTNQEWFDNIIKPYLFDSYSYELAENTYKYIKIPEKYNDIITNHNWEAINDLNVGNYIKYIELYNKILKRMNEECISESNYLKQTKEMTNILYDLRKSFEEKIKYDEYKNSLFDNMHKELMSYKNNSNDKNVEIMSLDIIQLLDIYNKVVEKSKSSEYNEDSYKKLINNFEGLLQDLLDVLYRQSIEPYEMDIYDEIDVKKQKIISIVETSDESLNNKLAFKNAPGYEKNGKIIRPERITIYKYKKGE